uniref:Uncharacterized protein n=1 Tax=Anguilla anguilla TaxID=7936 RepID=A0A0E9X605_ANGAN
MSDENSSAAAIAFHELAVARPGCGNEQQVPHYYNVLLIMPEKWYTRAKHFMPKYIKPMTMLCVLYTCKNNEKAVCLHIKYIFILFIAILYSGTSGRYAATLQKQTWS